MRVVTIRLTSKIKLILGLWCLCELLAFIAVAQLIGVTGAIFLGVATSLVGFSLLKRAGAAAMLKLRATLEGRAPAAAGDVLDDTLAAAGALALVLPGFLSDITGVGLSLPIVRAQVARFLGRGGGSQARPETIDLAPGEWHSTDPAARPISKV